MNTKNLKSYAPKARRQFMDAIEKRAAHFGIYPDKIVPVSIEGDTALIEGRAFSKHQGLQRKHLEKQINDKPLATHKERFELFIREMAYTWFNRLAALRYMELHDYLEHGFRVLSNKNNKDALPEILDHAADVADILGLNKTQIIEWQLAGNQQELLYRELLLGQCHYLHGIMPFLFEAIDDATELLLPDNLTKTDSLLKDLVNEIPEEDWQQIEVIGWLYQFYISEHKDAVIGKVVKSEDIPAATQLFTPNWIVKYLVQNSIGRQWLATYPDSSIKTKMEYYIKPAEQTDEVKAQLAAITPSSIDPESIKALDPACGSGHILVEIYELLREIYLERGYRQREIPELILTKNIYGLDIDDRAAQLAGFALLMKAREDDRRIFQRVQDGSVKLNIHSLQSTEGWDSAALWQALNLDGKAKQGSSGDLFEENSGFQQPAEEYAEYFDLLKYLIVSFEQAKTLGSLIHIAPQYLPTLKQLRTKLLDKLNDTDPATVAGAIRLLPVLEQAIVLTQKYDAVVANPPYMGGKGMNASVKSFINKYFKESNSDLFSVAIERFISFGNENSYFGFMTPFTWMFLNSYLFTRDLILKKHTLTSLIQPQYHTFFESAAVPLCAFVIEKVHKPNFTSTFIRLENFRGADLQPLKTLEAISNPSSNWLYLNRPDNFLSIPGHRIAYWASRDFLNVFKEADCLGKRAVKGLDTGGNIERFLRLWHEVDLSKFSKFGKKESKWFPLAKGGPYRKWYGNNDHVINYASNGEELKNNSANLRSRDKYFRKGLTWTVVTIADFCVRLLPEGFLFDQAGSSAFCAEDDNFNEFELLSSLNSKITKIAAGMLSPTISSTVGDVREYPILKNPHGKLLASRAIEIAKIDWDLFERSWEFKSNPLVTRGLSRKINISDCFDAWLQDNSILISELEEIEEKNNRYFIESYSLSNEINPIPEKNKLTLTINPEYRYGENVESAIVASRLKCDTSVELISFSLGCMMGRYSLDREGIIYAHSANEGFKELITEGAYNTFPADDDGIIPLASEEWLFEDDATSKFREFVKAVWGTEHLQENLEFVAESLCLNAIKPKKGESSLETIRRYFSTQFFADHCKTYKKRPIYWLFSSGKEKAFECLVYLHRYNEATLARMRTEYVTPLMGKYTHQIARKVEEVIEATGTEQRRIEKEIKDLEKKQLELRKFDEELKHYTEMRISLDLDDGVKANYGKFGNLLANVKDICG